MGNSLAWLGLVTFTAGALVQSLVGETKILQAASRGQKEKVRNVCVKVLVH